MKVTKIELKNILGLRELAVDCHGSITRIEGRNGSGKSSALAGIRTAIGGGNLATLRNIDAPEDEAPEAVIVLDGDEHGTVIVEKKNNKLRVRKQVGDSAAMEDVPAPQRFLDALFDGSASNPVKLLTAKDKELIDTLLEALPLDHDPEELWKLLNLDPKNFKIPTGLHPLKELAHVHDAIYEARTGINRDEKAKRGAADQNRRKIPAEIPDSFDTSAKEDHLIALRQDIISRREQATATAQTKKHAAQAMIDAHSARIEAELEAAEERMRAEVAERLAAMRAEGQVALDETRAKAAAECMAAEDELAATTSALETATEAAQVLAEEIAGIREQEKAAIGLRVLRDQADEYESEADKMKALSARYTAALKRLKEYKARLCDDLPIKGLDISGGEIRVHGVPWEQLNTAQRIRLAVTVATLRLKDKPFRPVIVDGAEALDEEQLALLESELEAAGAQAFIARVTDGDLQVGTK